MTVATTPARELPTRSLPPTPARMATPPRATIKPAICGGRRRSCSSPAAKAAVNNGVQALSTEVSAEVMCSSPHAISVKGMTLIANPRTSRCPQVLRSGNRWPVERRKARITARPSRMRPQARNVGGTPSTTTLMNRNDQPQMKASSSRRRKASTPDRDGDPMPGGVPASTRSTPAAAACGASGVANKSTLALTKSVGGGTMAAFRLAAMEPRRSPMARAASGRLAGRTVLITGASQGLGRAVALACAREGANLLLVARRAGPLEEARAEAESLGARAIAVAADVGDASEAERVAAAALDAFERVDVLVNNASELGPTPMPYLIHTDPDALRRVLEVNLLGPFLLTRALLGPMLAAGSGSVINLSSDAGVVGYPGWGAYGVSKAALDQMTRIWASELEDTGVRVNSVDPGDMATALHAAALPEDDPAELARPGHRTRPALPLLRPPATAGAWGPAGRQRLAHAAGEPDRLDGDGRAAGAAPGRPRRRALGRVGAGRARAGRPGAGPHRRPPAGSGTGPWRA